MSGLIFRMLLASWFLLFSFSGHAIIHPDPPASKQFFIRQVQSLTIKDLQRLAGRKLSFKEKITWQLLKWRISHPGTGNLIKKLKSKPASAQQPAGSSPDEKSMKKGQASFVFGLAGLGLLALVFVIPFMIFPSIISALLAIILGHGATKGNRENKKGQTGKILGYVTISLIAILLAIALTNFELF